MEDELEQRAADYLSSALGFNGERIDPVLGGYHLGNGYRLYNPALRRFTSPDSMSPFGAGGINPYAYCEGDPINNTDPTGHSGIFGAIINVGMFAADLFTDGAASAAEEAMFLARGEDVIAVREARQAGGNAIGSREEAANIAKYGKPYPSQGEHGRANFKLFRPDAEGLRNLGRTKEPKSLSALMSGAGGYTDNFNETGEPGLVAHGAPGVFKYVKKSREVVPLGVVDWLKQVEKDYGLKLFQITDTPLHILACHTSAPELGIKLADTLGRPIVLYGTGNEVITSNARELLSGIRTEILGRGDGSVISINDLAEAVKTTYTPSNYRYIG